MNLILAEMMSKSGVLWESSHLSQGDVQAGLFFLLLMCVGMAIDFGLVVYCIKRPTRVSDWVPALTARSLPSRLVFLLFLILIGLYLTNSLVYGMLFSSVEVEPYTLFFQTLFFHVPALLILFGVLRLQKISGCECLGLVRGKTLRMLGLSVLLYLAALPILWFYSLLYQIFLDQLGHSFYLQDVTQVFLAPMPWPSRAAVFFIAIVGAPVFEEIVFRGILFPWLVRRAGFWPGVAVVSALFAAMHLHLPSLLPLFLLSTLFCVAYARTRSLWVPIGMHACFNGVTIIFLTLMG